jgi:hypothetical protein
MRRIEARGPLKRPFSVEIVQTVQAWPPGTTYELPSLAFACTSYACAVECGSRIVGDRTDRRLEISLFCPCCRLTGHEPKADGTPYQRKACSFCNKTGRV